MSLGVAVLLSFFIGVTAGVLFLLWLSTPDEPRRIVLQRPACRRKTMEQILRSAHVQPLNPWMDGRTPDKRGPDRKPRKRQRTQEVIALKN